MKTGQIRVTFEPTGRSVSILPGSSVLEAAGRAGLAIETPCGGAGTCGKCRVRLIEGAGEPNAAERAALPEEQLDAGWRLACQTHLDAEARVEIPAESLFGDRHRILTASAAGTTELRAAVRKQYVELPEPTLADDAADLLRLERAIGPFEVPLELMRLLPQRLRGAGWRGTCVLADGRLVDFEPGDTTDRCLGAAIDVGTTTLVGSLLDLTSGRELALLSAVNPQVSFGDDVLARIERARGKAEGLAELRRVVIEAINDLLARLAEKAGTEAAEVREVTVAGNTTMQHLLCGLDVTPLGEAPFVPTHARGLDLPAEVVGVEMHPRGRVYVFPVIGGFVGGDTVAGLLTALGSPRDKAALLIDIGTNGEIVLSAGGKLYAASTAAGPAFEGARISHGMRATQGAIEKVLLAEDVELSVIGDVEPIGLCGSALVDAAAELLRAGLITEAGRLLPPEELPAGLPQPLARRVRRGESGVEFVLAEGASGAVTLTERDVRELQLATGAIRAGVRMLLDAAGLGVDDLETVLLAGGFGSFIRRSNAQRIGLLPAGLGHEAVQYVGNASLAGARWALLSTAARARAEQLARTAAHVELSQDPAFQMIFAEAMIFPSR